MAAEILGAVANDVEGTSIYRFMLGRMIICPIHQSTPVFPLHLLEQMPHSVDKIHIALH